MRPPDKRKPAPMVFGTGSKIDRPGRQIDKLNNSLLGPPHQGLYPHTPLPCPVAVARQFGFCHAIFVRHLTGQEERRGLFGSVKNASLAAKELNCLFSQERGTGA